MTRSSTALAATLIFVDTGAWFASVVPTDANHSAASRWLKQNRAQLVTTDYVIDETLTLLRVRGHSKRALAIGDHFFNGHLARVYYLEESDISSAWTIFRGYVDKEWSFTDCTSKVVIDRLGLRSAFAFDLHFHQFGRVTVVP